MVDYVNLDPSCPLCCAWGALQENFPEDYSTVHLHTLFIVGVAIGRRS